MFDAETVTTQVGEQDTTHSATRRICLLKRHAARRLTRAHLDLAARPAIATAGNQALTAIGEELSRSLGAPVSLDARVLDAAINPFGGLSRYSAFALLELGALGQLGILELDLATLNGLLAKVAGTPARAAAPSRLTSIEEAAIGWLGLSALAVVRKCEPLNRRFGPRLLGIYTQRGEVLERIDCRLRHLAVEITIRMGDSVGAARLLLPSAAVTTAIADLEPVLPGELAAEVLCAGLMLRSFIGRCVLDARDMAGLQLGDVVMLGGVASTGGSLAARGRLTASTFELHGHFSPDGFTLTRAETRATSLPQEPTMKSRDDAAPSLPVEVEIELTRIRLAISELATLRPGAVLPLRIGANDPVTLRIGDRAVARAELVEIEGEVGARIIGLLK